MTGARSCRSLTDQPTTKPTYKSSRMRRHNQFSSVRTSMMSVTHLVLEAVKSCSKWICAKAG